MKLLAKILCMSGKMEIDVFFDNLIDADNWDCESKPGQLNIGVIQHQGVDNFDFQDIELDELKIDDYIVIGVESESVDDSFYSQFFKINA